MIWAVLSAVYLTELLVDTSLMGLKLKLPPTIQEGLECYLCSGFWASLLSAALFHEFSKFLPIAFISAMVYLIKKKTGELLNGRSS